MKTFLRYILRSSPSCLVCVLLCPQQTECCFKMSQMQFWLKFPSVFKVMLGFYILFSSLELLLFGREALQPFLCARVSLSVLQWGGFSGAGKQSAAGSSHCRQLCAVQTCVPALCSRWCERGYRKAGRKRSCAQSCSVFLEL